MSSVKCRQIGLFANLYTSTNRYFNGIIMFALTRFNVFLFEIILPNYLFLFFRFFSRFFFQIFLTFKLTNKIFPYFSFCRYPFNDSEHASLFAKISRGQFLVPDCLTSKARCMIRSLLRKEPEERILSEDILLHPWMTAEENREYSSTSNSSKSSGDQMVPDVYLDSDDA